MTTKVYAGTEVAVGDDGFFTDPDQWRDDMAPEIAHEAGIDDLTEQHWQVITFMRHEYATKGTGPRGVMGFVIFEVRRRIGELSRRQQALRHV